MKRKELPAIAFVLALHTGAILGVYSSRDNAERASERFDRKLRGKLTYGFGFRIHECEVDRGRYQ